MTVRILQGDCRQVLKTLPDESVHCIVTSPPYYGLRDYESTDQIGLESSPAAYIETLVDVFHQARRVLRADGTLWLNLGDSYATSGRGGNPTAATSTLRGGLKSQEASMTRRMRAPVGFKNKDLMMMPARVAIALQDDGWYLRQDIIWSKPNPMPESVRDRCTKSHEHVFLLSKSESYFYDADAIAEPVAPSTVARLSQPTLESQPGSQRVPGKTNGAMHAVGGRNSRNRRSVWSITTKPFKDAHFATFPPELPEICIKAGCPRGGVTLDLFGGAGTTGLVADRLGRDAILIELSLKYVAMSRRRIYGESPMFAEVRP
jgi:DNA modification methylase